MTFLLDTNALSDVIAENEQIDRRMANLPLTDQVVICPMVKGEILYGIGLLPEGRRRLNLSIKSQQLISKFPSRPVDDVVGEAYAKLKLNGLDWDWRLTRMTSGLPQPQFASAQPW